MFERFFNRNNACNSTRGFSAEGTQRVCACCAAQSENMNSLLSLDTALQGTCTTSFGSGKLI